MLVFAGREPAAAAGAQSSPRSRGEGIYQRHADALYRQAVVTLGDADMAARIVADVLTAECAG